MPKTDLPAAARTATASNEKSFDFRLDEDLAAAVPPAVRTKSPSEILAGAERELAASARATSMAGAGRMVAAGAAGAALVEPVSESIEQKIETARLAADLDFHLDEAEKPSAEMARAPDHQTHTSSQAAIELSKLDLSFEDEKSVGDDDTPSVLDGQWHDAATKLDLAKAYQEMGDVEGAREILQEVLHEGDDNQKSEAQALLAKLG
jgi:pilus assembly protein FimV